MRWNTKDNVITELLASKCFPTANFSLVILVGKSRCGISWPNIFFCFSFRCLENRLACSLTRWGCGLCRYVEVSCPLDSEKIVTVGWRISCTSQLSKVVVRRVSPLHCSTDVSSYFTGTDLSFNGIFLLVVQNTGNCWT